MTLTLFNEYNSGIFEYPRFEYFGVKEKLPNIVAFISQTKSYQEFFNKTLKSNQKNELHLNEGLITQFECFSTTTLNGFEEAVWMPLPRFFDKSTKLYSLIFQNYTKAYFSQFIDIIDNQNEEHQHQLIEAFYAEVDALFTDFNRKLVTNQIHNYIHNTVLLTLFNLYYAIFKRYPSIHPTNELSLEELIYFVAPYYDEQKEDIRSTAYYICNYLNSLDTTNELDKTTIKREPLLELTLTPTGKAAFVGTINHATTLKILNVGDTALANYVKEGKIKKLKDGNRNLYIKEEILDFKRKRLRFVR